MWIDWQLWCLKTPSAALESAQSGFALSSTTVIRTDVYFAPHRALQSGTHEQHARDRDPEGLGFREQHVSGAHYRGQHEDQRPCAAAPSHRRMDC
ncbi:MAG: hypothetical protein DK306_001880 [Chloroflexi bacterium]|nr:MAG: hypothetical protein DK306_001880 [Chloroflexota bacterium]